MIQPKELRIGNVFHPMNRSHQIHMPSTAIFIKIVEIKAFVVSTCFADKNPAQVERWDEYAFHDLCPIPVTPALLEAAGFKRTVFEEEDALRLDLYVSVGRSLSMIYFPKSEAKGVILFNNATPVGETLYEYLHQVQNAYYSLTGKELDLLPQYL